MIAIREGRVSRETSAEDRDLLMAQAGRLGCELSPAQAALLLEFEATLRERGSALGLISKTDRSRLRERHVLDSLRASLAVRSDDRNAYDLGSGGGLPGLPVAIARPDLRVGLVERRRHRAAFLELAVEALGLANVSVLPVRIEALGEPVDVCFARALADLPACWKLAEPILRPGGRLLYFAGACLRDGLDVPGATHVTLLEAPLLERAGPLVIMTRQ